MTRSLAGRRSAHSLPVLAAIALGALTATAFAQGTDEQREACAPDAMRLCADTIPDIERTTACMKAHKAELSSRCQAAFPSAAAAPPAAEAPVITPHRKSVARAPMPEEGSPADARSQARDDDFPDSYPPGFGPSGRIPEGDR